MIDVRRAADRPVTEQPGITTRHCFSAGAHYDPDNTSFGALVAVDEHAVAPGCGFDWHAHRGVDIVSWVLDGALRHEDGAGRVQIVTAGGAQLQAAGSGIRHAEANASLTRPVRFVQLTALSDVDEPRYLLAPPPLMTSVGELSVHRAGRLALDAPRVHLYVARGTFGAAGALLASGDSVRADEPVEVDGTGELLVWQLA